MVFSVCLRKNLKNVNSKKIIKIKTTGRNLENLFWSITLGLQISFFLNLEFYTLFQPHKKYFSECLKENLTSIIKIFLEPQRINSKLIIIPDQDELKIEQIVVRAYLYHILNFTNQNLYLLVVP